ncbi:MAG: energy transducer TonB [Bacteroidales bacterium]|nr:energy transducer TonB [Bacteroidales bacterium]
MRQITIIATLLFFSTLTYSQVTIYYDDNGDITMRDLATHYRVAKVDTVLNKFIGEVNDFWMNDTMMETLNYDLKGYKDGVIKVTYQNGGLKIKGQYLNDLKSGKWVISTKKPLLIDFSGKKIKPNKTIDSLEICLLRKENFNVSQYIRKSDYPYIYSLISKSLSLNNKEDVLTVVEEKPYFPNGMQALGQFISAYIQYPNEALKNNIKGQVIVEFTITEDGSTSNFKIIKSLGYGCEEEAVRVLKLLPDWIPAFQRGKAVRTKFKLPITFE